MLAFIMNVISIGMIALVLGGSFMLALWIEKLVRGRVFRFMRFMQVQAQSHPAQLKANL